VNYQAFWNGGIRDGMLEMLDDARFREQVERTATEPEPYSEAFKEALRRYEELKHQNATSEQPFKNDAKFLNNDRYYGDRIEEDVRKQLARVPLFQKRADMRESFVSLLYRSRLYFLNLKPSSARSITGARLISSQSALIALAKLCEKENVRLVLLQAPVNPRVSLYRTSEDKESFHQFVGEIANQHNLTLLNFEDSVTAEHWGRLYNGPDPLHLGRAAHHQLAADFVAALKLRASK
jgi:hypothetical protein